MVQKLKSMQKPEHNEKSPSFQTGLFLASLCRLCALNLAAAEAPGAHIDVLGSTVDDSLNALYVGLPGTVGSSVRMADLNTKSHALIAKITLCHFSCTSLLEQSK